MSYVYIHTLGVHTFIELKLDSVCIWKYMDGALAGSLIMGKIHRHVLLECNVYMIVSTMIFTLTCKGYL